jgi:hypothetical protein
MKFVVDWIAISVFNSRVVSVSSNSGRILATMAAECVVFVVVLVVLSILDILCLEKKIVVVEKREC